MRKRSGESQKSAVRAELCNGAEKEGFRAHWSGSGTLKTGKNCRQQAGKLQGLDYNQYHLSAKEFVWVLGKSAAVSGLFAYVFYRSMQVFLLLLPVSVFLLFWRERRQRLKKRKLLLAQQFKEAMVILAASLSAGYAMENAMAVSLEELRLLYGEKGLIVQEFSGMVQQIRTNRNVEQVLLEFAVRSGLEDVQNLAEVLGIGKRTGGDLGSIMRHTAEVIRDKMQVKEEIMTLTASRQFEQKIMNLIPFFIVFYVEGTSPGFFDQMYRTGMGRCLMTLCMGLYLTAFWLSERILDIEV